jgi:hypothetical protein
LEFQSRRNRSRLGALFREKRDDQSQRAILEDERPGQFGEWVSWSLDINPPEKRWGFESIWILRFHAKKAAEISMKN